MRSSRIKICLVLVGICLFLFFVLIADRICLAAAGPLTESDIHKIVKAYIEKTMPWHQGTLRLEFLPNNTECDIKGKRLSWQIQSRRNEAFIGESSFNVRFYDQGVFIKDLPVRVNMEVEMDVVESTKSLGRDTEIRACDVRMTKKWFTEIPENVLSDPEQAVGKVLTTAVRVNAEITRNMLKKATVVKRGAMVKIVAESGPLLITTFGLSEENGGRGDVIRVKNISSNKIIYTKVVDQALVQVTY